MALIFVDSFDHYPTADLSEKWGGLASHTITTGGRFGTSSTRRTINLANLWRTLPNLPTITCGFAWKWTSAAAGATSNSIASFREATTIQVEVRALSSGQLRVSAGPNTYDSTQITLPDTWYFIELTAVIHASAGSFELRVNGETWLSQTGIDTTNTANNYATRFYFGNTGGSGTAGTMDYDDLYIRDDGTFLGDCRVAYLAPNGNGNHSDFTGSDADSTDNYLLVDEASNSEADYVESSTVGHIDTYAMGSLPSTPSTIHGVQQVVNARKTDASVVNMRHVIRQGGTNYEGSDVAVGDSSAFLTRVLETDPDTAAAWTGSGIDSMESGQKVQS